MNKEEPKPVQRYSVLHQAKMVYRSDRVASRWMKTLARLKTKQGYGLWGGERKNSR